MADAIPTPTDKQPETRSTVVVQQPMSQWSALKEAGWWTPFDTTIGILILILWITALYWKLFGHPGVLGLIALLLINLNLIVIWLIALVFRASWFVLRLNADIATLPNESARIAVAYLSGQAPPKKSSS